MASASEPSGPLIPASCEGCPADHGLPRCPSSRSRHLGKHLADRPAFLSWFRVWEAGLPPAQMRQSGCGSSSWPLAPPAAGGLPARAAQAGAVGSVGVRVTPPWAHACPWVHPQEGSCWVRAPARRHRTASLTRYVQLEWIGILVRCPFLCGDPLDPSPFGERCARAP